MKRNLSIVTALATTMLIAPACSKEKKGGDETAKVEASDKAGASRVEDKSATAKDKDMPAVASADFMAHMPASTEVVVSVSLAQLTNSPLWKQVGPTAMAAASKELGEIEANCGFNPLEKLQSAHVGINSANDKEPLFIVKGFGRDELSKCIIAMSAKEDKKVSVVQEGPFTIVSAEEADDNMSIAWIDDTTMLTVPGKSDKDYLQARLDGKDSLQDNAAFAATAGKAKQSQPVWFAAVFSEGSPAATNMGAMGHKPTGLFGSLGFDSGLQIDAGVSFADAAAASAALGMIKPFLGMAKVKLGEAAAVIDKLQLATQGGDLTVALNLSDGDLEKLSTLAAPMLGGMGGM